MPQNLFKELAINFWELKTTASSIMVSRLSWIYRSLDDFDQDLQTVILEHQAQNSYTTCMCQSAPQQRFSTIETVAMLPSRTSTACPTQLSWKRISSASNLLLDQAMPAFFKTD